ncbi:integrase family protein [Dechloromonas sp. ZS-1]|uniref:tyrosine-type recombinase/integrase n=1 Tax=Dechloromonas sp. ZS-1 TaxID=3138067 RepID=UPI0031FCDA8B
MATTRIHLTLERIRKLQSPQGNQAVYVFDDAPRQLSVRVTPAGSKSFVYSGKLNGIPLRVTIGSVDTWNLDDAREEARRLQRLIDTGIDPRELAKEEIAAKAAAKAAEVAAATEAENRKRYTLRALCETYTKHLEVNGKGRSAAATRSAFKCHVFSNDVANLPANEVSSLLIAGLVRKVRETGKERAAGILRSYLSAAYNAAKKAPFDASLPADLIPFSISYNPVDAIPAIKIKAGNRTLSTNELKTYMASLGSDLSDQSLKLALYAGGQRMAQLLRAKIGDYDDQTQTLRLWDSKGKRTTPREHLLPLAPEAAKIVSSLVTRAKERETAKAKEQCREPIYSNLWLFSTHGRVAMTFETPGIRAAEICAGMKGESFNLRDIRRTVETMLAGMGISKDTRAQLLSHGLSGVQSAHYDRHTYTDEKRRALKAWEAKLEAILSSQNTKH